MAVLPFVGSLIAFVVALLVGGLAIYLSARVVVDIDDYWHAVVTAVLGAIGWALTAWIPLIGPVIALVVWVAVINWRYPGGWVAAIAIALIAWVASLVVLYVLAFVGVGGFEAIGVPGA